MESVAVIQKEPLFNTDVVNSFNDIMLCDDHGEMKQSSSVLLSIASRILSDVLLDMVATESEACVILCGYSKRIVHALEEFSHAGCISLYGQNQEAMAGNVEDVESDFRDLGVHTPKEFWTSAVRDVKEEFVSDFESEENERMDSDDLPLRQSRQSRNNYTSKSQPIKSDVPRPKQNGSAEIRDKNGKSLNHLIGPDGYLNPSTYYKFDEDPKLSTHFCPICDDMPIRLPQDFELHMKDFHEELFHLLAKKFTCHKCQRTFDNIRNMIKHTAKPTCRRRDNTDRFKEHVSVTGVFSDPSTFVEVQLDSDSKRFLVYTCPICRMKVDNRGKGFPWGRHIMKYHRQHAGCLGKHYECKECFKKFAAGKYIKHKNRGLCATTGTCDHCGKYFDSHTKLQHHLRKLKSVETDCEKCGIVLKSQRNLKIHMRRHHGDPVTCDQCGKVFKNRENLRGHIFTIHTEDKDKPFHCSICGRGFGRRPQMLIHERNHRNEKPYKCRFCDYASSSSGNCWIHEKNVHKDLYHTKSAQQS